MRIMNCLEQNQSLKKFMKKHILVILSAAVMLAACSQSAPESTQQVEQASVTQSQLPEATPTTIPTPTPQPATETPLPTAISTLPATELPKLRKDQVAVERDDNLLRGTLVGDGEIAVLLAPGAMEPRGNWMQFAEYIAPMGYTVLAFDFPGPFGTSTGEFKYDQVQFDALAIIEHLKGLGFEQIVCMGNSIGGGACYEAARIDPSLAGFAIISSPVETTVEDSAELTMPKLLVTGDEKDVKGVLEETYNLMPEPKQYVFINQMKHGTEMLNTDDQLRDTLVEFLEGIRNDLDLDEDAEVSGDEGGD